MERYPALTVDRDGNPISQFGHEPIEAVEIEFQTPFGVFASFNEAALRLAGMDLDPEAPGMIAPVPVAYTVTHRPVVL